MQKKIFLNRIHQAFNSSKKEPKCKKKKKNYLSFTKKKESLSNKKYFLAENLLLREIFYQERVIKMLLKFFP